MARRRRRTAQHLRGPAPFETWSADRASLGPFVDPEGGCVRREFAFDITRDPQGNPLALAPMKVKPWIVEADGRVIGPFGAEVKTLSMVPGDVRAAAEQCKRGSPWKDAFEAQQRRHREAGGEFVEAEGEGAGETCGTRFEKLWDARFHEGAIFAATGRRSDGTDDPEGRYLGPSLLATTRAEDKFIAACVRAPARPAKRGRYGLIELEGPALDARAAAVAKQHERVGQVEREILDDPRLDAYPRRGRARCAALVRDMLAAAEASGAWAAESQGPSTPPTAPLDVASQLQQDTALRMCLRTEPARWSPTEEPGTRALEFDVVPEDVRRTRLQAGGFEPDEPMIVPPERRRGAPGQLPPGADPAAVQAIYDDLDPSLPDAFRRSTAIRRERMARTEAERLRAERAATGRIRREGEVSGARTGSKSKPSKSKPSKSRKR